VQQLFDAAAQVGRRGQLPQRPIQFLDGSTMQRRRRQRRRIVQMIGRHDEKALLSAPGHRPAERPANSLRIGGLGTAELIAGRLRRSPEHSHGQRAQGEQAHLGHHPVL
jgi:hypothetical protein